MSFSNLPDYNDPEYLEKMRAIGAPIHRHEAAENACDFCPGDRDCETCPASPDTPIPDLPRGSLFRRRQ